MELQEDSKHKHPSTNDFNDCGLWKKISGMKESIIRSFKKYALSVAFDESESAQVSIARIPNYDNT